MHMNKPTRLSHLIPFAIPPKKKRERKMEMTLFATPRTVKDVAESKVLA